MQQPDHAVDQSRCENGNANVELHASYFRVARAMRNSPPMSPSASQPAVAPLLLPAGDAGASE
jgi:hypothetical protein